jgi:integrase
MPRKKKNHYTSGKFYLLPPDHRYTSYRICWPDGSDSRKTHSFSTHTDSFEEAKKQILVHALKEGLGEKLKDEPLLTSINRYYIKVMAARPSENVVAVTMGDLTRPEVQDIIGSPMVSEMTISRQMALIDWYRSVLLKKGSRKYADSTIIRRLKVIWAAMNYSVELEHLAPASVPKLISTKRWSTQKGATRRLLTLEEVGKLLDAACSKRNRLPTPVLIHPHGTRVSYCVRLFDAQRRERYEPLDTKDAEEARARYRQVVSDHKKHNRDSWSIDYGMEWRLLIVLLGTACRRRAAVDLCANQIQHINTEYGVLDLNPLGRQQTTKFRPTIPIAHTFGKWLATFTPLTAQGHLVSSSFTRNSVQPTFMRLSRTVGFEASPHMIRHFVSTWLAHSPYVQSTWERDMFMGWKRPDGSAMGTVYNHYNPQYLRGCSTAVEALFEALSKHTYADIMLRGFADQPLPEEAWRDAPSVERWTPDHCIALLPHKSKGTLTLNEPGLSL